MEELTAICGKIGAVYEEMKETALKIAAKSREISDAKSEIHDVKQRVRLFLENLENFTFPDTDGESEEVAQLLTDKKDQITHLICAKTDSDETVEQYLAELDAECAKEMELTVSLSETRRDLYIEEIQNLLKKRKKEQLESELKANELAMHEVESRKTRVENRLAEVLATLGKDKTEPGGHMDLVNGIANIKVEIEGVEQQIEEMINKICESRNMDEREMREHQEKVDSLTNLYGFSGTKAEYQEEINRTKQEVAANSRQLCLIEEQIKAKERRLNFLKTLKRRNIHVDVPDDCTTDDLIAELKVLRSRSNEADGEIVAEHSQLVMQNNEYTERLSKRQRALEMMLLRFQTERDDMSQRIRRARMEATQREQDMLQAMKEFQKKAAPSTPKLKSSIAVAQKRAIPGSALKVIDRPEIMRSPGEKIILSIKRPVNQ